MDIVSLAHAKAQGLSRYFTGLPCGNGHVAERLVSNRSCLHCTKERLAKYKIENRDALLEKKRIAQKEYVQKHPERAAATRRATYAKHRTARNAEKAAWARRNRPRVLAWCRQRQLAKIQRTPAWLTEDDHWMIEQAYELAALRSKMFGFQWHVDHVLPLQDRKSTRLNSSH